MSIAIFISENRINGITETVLSKIYSIKVATHGSTFKTYLQVFTPALRIKMKIQKFLIKIYIAFSLIKTAARYF